MPKPEQFRYREHDDPSFDEEIKRPRNFESIESLEDIVLPAISKYKGFEPGDLEMRKAAVDRFCSKPFNLSLQEVKYLICEGKFW